MLEGSIFPDIAAPKSQVMGLLTITLGISYAKMTLASYTGSST